MLFNVFIGKLDFSRCHFGPFWVRMPYFRFGHSNNRKKAVEQLRETESFENKHHLFACIICSIMICRCILLISILSSLYSLKVIRFKQQVLSTNKSQQSRLYVTPNIQTTTTNTLTTRIKDILSRINLGHHHHHFVKLRK